MRLFKTIYENRAGFTVSEVFFVLNTEERDLMAIMIRYLEEDAAEGRKNKTIKRWTHWDEESIVFLKRCCNYGSYPEAELMDLNSGQLFKFVEKTLAKVYGPAVNFERWLDVSIDDSKQQGWMTKDEMREEMDYRRHIKALFDKQRKAKALLEGHHSDLRHANLKEPK